MTSNIRSTTRRIRSIWHEVVKKLSKDRHEQWGQLQTLLMRALSQFPDAKAAVVAAINELLGPNYPHPEPMT